MIDIRSTATSLSSSATSMDETSHCTTPVAQVLILTGSPWHPHSPKIEGGVATVERADKLVARSEGGMSAMVMLSQDSQSYEQ